MLVALLGCATSAEPLPVEKRVALTPPKNDIAVFAKLSQPVGQIIPVQVAIANGTDEPYEVDHSQIFAIDDDGQRILPVPVSEAIREAGDANQLKAGLTGAAKNTAIAAVAGAAIGAALGLAFGAAPSSAATGALAGAALGAGVGGLSGGAQGTAYAYLGAATQICALTLQPSVAYLNYTVSGYMFFPKGVYYALQLTLLNKESQQTRTITVALNGAAVPTTFQANPTSRESSSQGHQAQTPTPESSVQPAQRQVTE